MNGSHLVDVYSLPPGRYRFRGRSIPLVEDPNPEDSLRAVKEMLRMNDPCELEITGPLKAYRLGEFYPVRRRRREGYVNADALLGLQMERL